MKVVYFFEINFMDLKKVNAVVVLGQRRSMINVVYTLYWFMA